MKTRQQELDDLQGTISGLVSKASEARTQREREKLQAQADALGTTGRRLINQRHDQLDTQRTAQQAALQAIDANRETQMRQELRRGFKGSDLDFERLYPTMRDRYLVETTLARAGEIEPAMKPSIVI